MRYVWIVLFATTAFQICSAEVVYNHPRMDPYRYVGLAPDGQSIWNFANEPSFAVALRDFFGFTDREVGRAIDKAKRGECSLFKVSPGSHFERMWGANRKSIGPGRITFWAEYIQITVGRKYAKFLTICGNPVMVEGQEIKPRIERVTVTIRGPERIRRIVTPGPERIVRVTVPGPERIVERTIEVERYHPPVYGPLIQDMGHMNSRTTVYGSIGYVERPRCSTPSTQNVFCPPGTAPAIPIPPINGPPNPPPPNSGLGPPPGK